MTIYKNIGAYYTDQALSQGYQDFTACLASKEESEKVIEALNTIINFGRYSKNKLAITEELKNALSVIWDSVFDFNASASVKNNFLMLVNQVKGLLLYAGNNENGSFYHCMLKIIDDALTSFSKKVKF